MIFYRSTKLKALVFTAAIFTAAPQTARADLFDPVCTADPNLIVLTDTMLTLSSDIGTMADRILVTEDKIGEMADRIVETENLLAETLSQLNQNGGIAPGSPGILLSAPVTGDVVSRGTAPSLQLSDDATSYVVYLSPTANFSGDQVLPLLVTPQTPLADSWSQAVQSINAAAIYIAVRSVTGQSGLSGLSNAVRVTLQ